MNKQGGPHRHPAQRAPTRIGRRSGHFRRARRSQCDPLERRCAPAPLRAGAGNAADLPLCFGPSIPRWVRLLERLAPLGAAPPGSTEGAAPGVFARPSRPRAPRARPPRSNFPSGRDAGASFGPPPSRPAGSGLRFGLARRPRPGRARNEPGRRSAADHRPGRADRPNSRRGFFREFRRGFRLAARRRRETPPTSPVRLDRLLRREARRHGIEMDEP